MTAARFAESFARELRLTLRRLAATPRLTVPAVACVAMGVASTLLVVALGDAILLRAPAIPDAERLARVWFATGGDEGDLSYPEARDVAGLAAFDSVEIVARTRMAVRTPAGSERLRGEAVTPGYFARIGREPIAGRLFSRAEHAGAERAVLIGYDVWQRHFGGRPDAVGSALRVAGGGHGMGDTTYTVVGVMPRGFAGTVDPDVSEFWLPIAQSPHRMSFEARDVRNVWVLARLAPGVSLAAAQSAVAALSQRLAAAHGPLYADAALVVEPFGESWREPLRAGMRALLGAGALLLLIACVNVAHLLLARLARREPELAMRRLLGAQGPGLLAGLLLEPLVIAATGGALGAAAAVWGVGRLAEHPALELPAYVSLAPDLRLVAAAIGVVAATALLFGVVPAWLGLRVGALQRLRAGGGRGGSLDRRQRRLGRLLLASELGITFVLVVAGALLLRTWMALAGAEVGFRTANVLRMAITLDAAEYPDDSSVVAFADRAREALRRQPGVRDVALMSEVLPPWFDDTFAVVWRGETAPDLRDVARHAIDRELLRVLDVPLVAGRAFTPADRAGAPAVGLVSESLARRLGDGARERVLGRRLQLVVDPTTGELGPPIEVVGVVRDVAYHGALGPTPGQRIADASPRPPLDLWVPFEQSPSRVVSLAIHTDVDPATTIPALSRELSRLAPSSPLHWISTMEEELAAQLAGASFYGKLTTIYGASAALLAMFGVYGIAANGVARRRRELAVRAAVGARRGDLLGLVLRDGLRTVTVGVTWGAAVAVVATRLLRGLLWGVQPHDPLVFGGAVALLFVLGLLACWLPARRAAALDPAMVLREE